MLRRWLVARLVTTARYSTTKARSSVRCELIPENEREAKKEGPFAGLEGLVVVKDGLVEDHEHNVVGKVVEGDPKKLLGRAVDEDGDIIDKYGNVKGHCEPYEIPEEEVVAPEDSVITSRQDCQQARQSR